MNPVLELRGISKAFGGHKALDDVSIQVNPGEIIGLVGANGSGKSTLMNVLYGHPVIKETGGYEGQIYMEGEAIVLEDTAGAIKAGIGMVHQEFALFPRMNVAENIQLGSEITFAIGGGMVPEKIAFIDQKANHIKSKQTLSTLGIDLNTTVLVKQISTNMKQFVEIARELSRKQLKLLILDEPTAVLNTADSIQLMAILKSLSEKGVSIIFISHRLDEIKSLCDRVIVLRDGVMVSSYVQSEMCERLIANDMIGEAVVKSQRVIKEGMFKPLLRFENFSAHYPGDALKSLTLEVYKGEILGLTSLSGQGKLAVGKGLMSFCPTEGSVYYKGDDIMTLSYKERIQAGLYVLCEDRKSVGLLLNQSIEDNIGFSAQQVFSAHSLFKKLKNLSFTDHKSLGQDVAYYTEVLNINCRSPKQKVSELSGGNQQKVCLARSLSMNPDILIVSEPTRGIDIAAKELLLEHLKQLNETSDMTIIIISSELEELQRICDRIGVISEGCLHSVLPPDASSSAFGLALSGGEEDCDD